MDFPTPARFGGEDGDHVPLEGEVFDPHDLQVGDDPVHGFSRQGSVKPEDILDHQGNRSQTVKRQVMRIRPFGMPLPDSLAFGLGLIGPPDDRLVVLLMPLGRRRGVHGVEDEIQMADCAVPGEFVEVVFLQSLYHHKAESGDYRAPVASALAVESRMIRGKGGERILQAETSRILEFGDELFGSFLIRNLGEQQPIRADSLGLYLPFRLIEIVIKTVLDIPHFAVDPGFQGKVIPLEKERHVLVVQDIPERRDIEGVHGHDGVEIHHVAGIGPGGVGHPRRGHGRRVQAVFPLEILLQPVVMLFERGHDVLHPLFVRRLVIEVVLRPGEERKGEGLGIFGIGEGFSGLDIVAGADGAVLFLHAVEGVEAVGSRIDAVAVHQEEGRKCLLHHVQDSPLRIVEELDFFEGSAGAARCPAVRCPGPGSIVYLHKILIVEVDSRKVFLVQIWPLSRTIPSTAASPGSGAAVRKASR
ncbi:hypothetical protein SDC9_13476 [bioreactor metagenome]|uniref:Uncharacterized protein n=1 Tax=bioreactor metagenome TaxID=1076179 RepID=A0A644TLG2_9ZZZZ